MSITALAGTAQAQWSDEFNGTGAVDSSTWTYDVGGGGWGNAELEYYQSGTANASQSGGFLRIQARQESVGGMAYTSARIKTQGIRTFQQGQKVEARLRVPTGQGTWPAFWALGANITTVPWPGCGEIDIMEHVNLLPNNVGTIHWIDNNGINASYTAAQPAVANFADWNNYGIEWNSSLIRWTLNGAYVGDANIAGAINGTDEFGAGKPFFVIMNVAVGGSWPGNPDGSAAFPWNLDADWIHVTTLGAATPTATATTAATATPTTGATATATSSGTGNCAGVSAFASCTAYANGAKVVFNNTLYHSIAAVPATRDCPPNSPFDPSTDNWWVNDGACSGGATATATATPTRTPTATATNGATATRTNTATATATATATTTGNTVVNVTLPYNVNAHYTNGTTFSATGGIDGVGSAYSSTLLGANLSWSGTTFTFGPANVLNGVRNTTITLPAGQYGTLMLLGTGVNGDQTSATVRVNYTDGTNSTFTQTFSNWLAASQNVAGQAVAFANPYRVKSGGTLDNRVFNLYGYNFALNSAKSVSSLVLPATNNVVVLSAVLRTGAGATPTATTSGATATATPTTATATPTSTPTATATTSGTVVPTQAPGCVGCTHPRLKVINGCGQNMWIQYLNGTGGGTLSNPNHTLLSGLNSSVQYDIPDIGIAGVRFWPSMGCDSTGNNCTIGASGGPASMGFTCPAAGCGPPVDSKFEATFGCMSNIASASCQQNPSAPGTALGTLDWWNTSAVDGYTLPATVKAIGNCPIGAQPNGPGGPPGLQTSCAAIRFADCPTAENLSSNGQFPALSSVNLNLTNPATGAQAGCFSPSGKLTFSQWNTGFTTYPPSDPHAQWYSCPTPPITSTQCAAGPASTTAYRNVIHSKCTNTYAFPYDDTFGLATCPSAANMTYEVTFFCPQ
jgi:beta-glucanase (GH16 family)